MATGFNKSKVEEQIKFINDELQKDKKITVTNLCKKFKLNRSTLISRFTRLNYKYDTNTRKYVKNITPDVKLIQEKDIVKSEEIAMDIDTDTDASIKELAKHKDDILNVVKEHRNTNDKVSDDKMIIDTELVEGKVVNHNFKVYENVKKEIQEFQKQYPQFRLQDLVSTALHQFYLKHKKCLVNSGSE
ncbi:hypothetical protein ACJDU8_25455 [Clostridium sp. WILCCON 0269]|uniref:DNA-binding protein n=1 Tax=Candidatus Clostridium eludens TaxID=3381663 RepID=A0ABW8SSH5_9CLOT